MALNYHRHIDRDHPKEHSEQLAEQMNPRRGGGYADPYQAFFCHQYVYRHVEYADRHAEGREIRTPQDVLRYGGNCEEQGVLLSSLLEPYLFTQYRLLDLQTGEFGHISLQVSFGDRRHMKPVDLFDELYQSMGTLSEKDTRPKAWSSTPNPEALATDTQHWYFADPVMSEYIGDTSGLINKGYIKDTSDGWEWDCDATVLAEPGTPNKTLHTES